MESTELRDIGAEVMCMFEMLLTFNNSDQFSQHYHRLTDEEQRFRLWAHSLGLRQQGHASLDYRVQDSVVIKDHLAHILLELKEHLENLLAIGKDERRPFEEDVDIVINTDDEDSTNNDVDSYVSKHSHSSGQSSFHEVDIRLQSLTDIVDTLYRLATKIRNPRNRPQRSNNQLYKNIPEAERSSYITEREDTETMIAAHRLRQQIIHRRLPYGATKPQSSPEELADQDVKISCWLVRRTGIANARRKQYFIYWKGHAHRLSQAPTQREQTPAIQTLNRVPSQNELRDVLQGGVAPGETSGQTVPAQARSSATSATKPQANHLKPDDLISDISHYSRVSTVMDQNGERLEWPLPPPKYLMNSKKGHFTCPYCHILCPERYLEKDNWRVHCIHDLKPYHCTYEDCQDPHWLYETRQDWIDHETQHSQVWHCLAHCQEFETQAEYTEHLKGSHCEAIPKNLSPESIRSAVGPSQNPRRSCPFCSVAFSQVTDMQKHIIFHLEQFALFALPVIGDELDGDNDDYSQEGWHHDRESLISTDRGMSMSDIDMDFDEPMSDPSYDIGGQSHRQDVTEENLKLIKKGARSWKSWLHNEQHWSYEGQIMDDSSGDVTASVADDAPIQSTLQVGIPGRIELIYDRGEKLYHLNSTPKQHPQYKTYIPISCDVDQLLRHILVDLDAAHVTSGLDENKYYVPRSKLPQILTPERVRTILNHPYFSYYPDKDELTTRLCFGTGGSSPCLKLLAVLIGTNLISTLLRYIEDGMDDECFPMTVDTTKWALLECRRHGKNHGSINDKMLFRPNERREFARWSHALVAPYITCGAGKHLHYILNPSDVFPMTIGPKVQKDETAGVDQRVPTNMVPPPFNAYGGFSEVYRVEIDVSHFDFRNIGMRNPYGLFALKKLTSHNRENFNLELSSLLFYIDKATGERPSKHLIQLLATFEVQGATRNSTFYLLFDWAEGSLCDFWKANQRLVGNNDHCIWMSQQLHEICMALQCVHNERLEILKSIDQSKLERGLNGRDLDVHDLYGRHGDIKPDNLLWFRPNASLDHLALSDFGLGRLHTQVSRSKQNPRDLTWTATYRAPEFDLADGMISRASDIFSLGCVFLEHVSWFLRGLHSVENVFPERRSDKDIHDFLSDTFFTIGQDQQSGKPRPFLKSSVRAWISELQQHNNCSWYLHQLLEIIRDKMLEPDRGKRINVLLLTKDMETLRRTCEGNPSFYLKTKKEA